MGKMIFNKILFVFIAFDIIFLGCAVLHLLIPLMTHASLGRPPTLNNVASDLLLDHAPLTVSMVNSFIMMFAFLLSLPPLILRRNQIFLHLLSFFIIASAIITLVIGLIVWFSTLETHINLAPIWNAAPVLTQSMLQFKFQCCGYSNPALFIKDRTCPTAKVAAQLGPCMIPFGVFDNQFLDVVFTAFFGFVAVDVMFLLATMCLIKDRKEKERYKLIDEKRGYNSI